jgi:nucleotide-binding universal stress UspA family protein
VHVVNVYKTASGATMAMASEAAIIESVGEADEASREQAEQVCAKAVTRAERAGVHARGHAVDGVPADALIRVAEEVEADLIVVGNRGMSGARRFVLGSVPNKVSHHCPTNLLIVDTSPGNT